MSDQPSIAMLFLDPADTRPVMLYFDTKECGAITDAAPVLTELSDAPWLDHLSPTKLENYILFYRVGEKTDALTLTTSSPDPEADLTAFSFATNICNDAVFRYQAIDRITEAHTRAVAGEVGFQTQGIRGSDSNN